MTKMKSKVLLLGSACAALFVGCGGDGGGSGSGFSADVIAAECDYLFRCAGSDDDTAYDRMRYGSQRACAQSAEGYDFVAAAQPYIDAGTVVFDSAAARRCIEELRATCSETLVRELACEGIFVGQVADGGGCSDDIECGSQSCTGDERTCGMCRPRIATGAPCTFNDVCANGPNGEYGYCTDVCVLDTEALPTADAMLGTPCNYQQRCEPGLYCQEGTCARWRTLGEACDPYEDSCGDAAYCRESDDDSDVGTCVAVRMETGPGEDCGFLPTEVVVCDPGAGLYCTGDWDDAGVCALYQATVAEGDSCESTAECVDGLDCVDEVCVGDPVADGVECRRDAQCVSGNCVRALTAPFTSTCQPLLVCL